MQIFRLHLMSNNIFKVMGWKLFTKDPCKKCIVQACCTSVCKSRCFYNSLENDYYFMKGEIFWIICLAWKRFVKANPAHLIIVFMMIIYIIILIKLLLVLFRM